MRFTKHLWALSLFVALFACEPKGPEAGDGITHWLTFCESTADCEGDGVCLCNVCTEPCADDGECSRDGEEGSCVATSSIEASCGELEESRICVGSCGAGDTCDEGLTCGDFGCLPEPMETPMCTVECEHGGACSGATCECPAAFTGPTCADKAAFLALDLGSAHTCVIFERREAVCWGANDRGQLGRGSRENLGDEAGEVPITAIDLGGPIDEISAGDAHTCVRIGDRVKCFGDNTFGQLGLGDTEARGDDPGEMGDALPFVALAGPVQQVSAGQDHSCALLVDGRVQCWGNNTFGQLGLGDAEPRGDDETTLDEAIDFGAMRVVQVVASAGYSCAVGDDDSVWCWGRNQLGQLGLEDDLARGDAPGEMATTRVELAFGPGAVQLSSSGTFVCALHETEQPKCWGFNGVGQLGLGDSVTRGDGTMEMGTDLPGLKAMGRPTLFAAGGNHACGYASPTLKCWGQNGVGQLGLGDTNARSDDPGEVAAGLEALPLPDAEVTHLGAGELFTCVVLESNSLYCFGANESGQLGQADIDARGDEPDELIPIAF